MRLLTSIVFASAAILTAAPARAACDSPYWTLTQGATRHYKSSTGHEFTSKVTKVDGSKVTIESTSANSEKDKDKPPRSHEMEVDCTGEGVTMDFTSMGEQREGMEMKIIKRSGQFLPPASKLKTGYSWETTSTAEMTSARMKNPMTMDLKSSHKVEGTESVKVPAGSFEALKLSINTETTTQMPEMKAKDGSSKHPGMTMPAMTMHTIMTMWLVKGVGMVKSETKIEMGGMGSAPGAPGAPAAGAPVTTELLDYSK